MFHLKQLTSKWPSLLLVWCKKHCFSQTPSKNEQNQKTQKTKNVPRTVRWLLSHPNLRISRTPRNGISSIRVLREIYLFFSRGGLGSGARFKRRRTLGAGVRVFFPSLCFILFREALEVHLKKLIHVLVAPWWLPLKRWVSTCGGSLERDMEKILSVYL